MKYFTVMCQGLLKTRYIIDAWRGSEYSSNSDYTWLLNMLGLHKVLKKCCTIDAWQISQYFSGFEHGRVLNMRGLHQVLNKTLHYRCLIGFWICLYFLNGRVTGSCEFCANCILEINRILNMPQVLNIPRFWMHQKS